MHLPTILSRAQHESEGNNTCSTSRIVAFSLPPIPVQTFLVALGAISHEFSPVLTPLLPYHTRICTLVTPCCASMVGMQISNAIGAARAQG